MSSQPQSSRGMMHEPIPTKAQWLEWTEVKYKIRSMALRKLDSAIGDYEKSASRANELAIRNAFMAWKREKGPDWAKNERNRYPYDAITNLDATLRRDLGLSEQEKQAIEFWKAKRAESIQRVFQNASITLRNFNGPMALLQCKRELAGTLSATGGAVQGGLQAAANAALGGQIAEIRAALSSMFGVQITDVTQLAHTLISEPGLSGMIEMADHVASLLPLISVIAGGVKTLGYAAKAVYAAYAQVSFSTHDSAFESGNPAAAFDAVQKLLARETANAAAKAGIEAVSFAANTALHAAKGVGSLLTPTVAAAKATANAVRVITHFAVGCRETLLAREALKHPEKLDLRIFDQCPLLGAYMLVGSDTSELVALLFEEFGQIGWREDVEALVKDHIGPALDRCQALIQSSPFIVTNIPAHRQITGNYTKLAMLTPAG